jgi:hypothetical protein
MTERDEQGRFATSMDDRMRAAIRGGGGGPKEWDAAPVPEHVPKGYANAVESAKRRGSELLHRAGMGPAPSPEGSAPEPEPAFGSGDGGPRGDPAPVRVSYAERMEAAMRDGARKVLHGEAGQVKVDPDDPEILR